MVLNPIVVRHARVQFRLERLGPASVLAGYLLLLVLAFVFTCGAGAGGAVAWKERLAGYWRGLCAIQIFVLIVAGAVKVAGSIVREREFKRLDFELVTGMPSWRIAEGELVGSCLFHYFLTACSLPFTLLCVLAGGASWEVFGSFYMVLLAGAFFFHSWALLISAVSRTHAGSVALTLTVVSLFSAFALLRWGGHGAVGVFGALSPLSVIFDSASPGAQFARVGFFNRQLSEPFVTTMVYVFFGAWFLNAAARRVRAPGAPYLSRLQALIFTASFLIAVSGVLAGRVPSPGHAAASLFYQNAAIYLSALLVVLLVLIFLLTPSGEIYAAWRGGVRRSAFADGAPFPAAAALVFAAGAAVFFGVFVQTAREAPALSAPWNGEIPLAGVSFALLFVLLAAMFWSLLVQLFCVAWRRAGRETGCMLLAGVFVLAALPQLLGVSTGARLFNMFSPVVVLLSILCPGAPAGAELAFGAIFVYSLLCLLAGILLVLRLRAVSLPGQPGRTDAARLSEAPRPDASSRTSAGEALDSGRREDRQYGAA